MRSFSTRAFRPLLLAAVSLAVTSCIAWGGKLSRLDPEDFSAPQHPLPLTFETVYLVNGKTDDKRSTECEDLVAEALRDTGVFASVAATTTRDEVHLAFTFEETFNEGAVFTSSFLCGLTLFLFPAVVKGNTSLETMVYDGGVRGPVKFDEDFHFVMQILLLPATPFFWPPRVADDLMRNLVFNAVHDSRLGLVSSAQPSF